MFLTVGCEARLPLGGRCARPADCEAPLVCGRRGRCQAACVTSRDCGAGLQCVRDPGGATSTCALEATECGLDGRSCPDDLVCLESRCVNACIVGDECPDGVCTTGACVPDVERIDAAVIDAGALDAPPPLDVAAGIDAGEIADAMDAGEIADAMDALEIADASMDALEIADASPDAGPDGGPLPRFETTLVAPDGAAGDRAGLSVALSADGAYAIVGVPFDDVAGVIDAGSARVLSWTGTSWTEQAVLVAPTPAADDHLGSSVALAADGSFALVGAPDADLARAGDGIALAYTRSGTVWLQTQTLSMLTPAASAAFGTSVALSGDGRLAAVGTPGEDQSRGTVHTYFRAASSFALSRILLFGSLSRDDRFGASVAISTDGRRVMIGAPYYDGAATDAGGIFVFSTDGSSWTADSYLDAPAPADGANFGCSVSLSADGLGAVAGAWGVDGPGGADTGVAYALLRRASGAWALEGTLLLPSGAVGDALGWAVAMSGDRTRALVGAPRATTAAGASAGSASLFSRSAVGIWSLLETVTSPDGAAGDALGSALALAGTSALVASPGDDGTAGLDTGSVAFFTLAP